MTQSQFVPKDLNNVITVGIPLPSFIEHITDVSEPTRNALEAAYDFARDQGLDVFEIKKRGINVSANHNDLVNSMKGDWLLICGSDHTFGRHAIHTLWQSTQTKPFPKIVGGVMPYRNPPHAPVFGHLNAPKECLYSCAPYKHYHPGITMSGELMKIDAVGSGFTIYHRSVFDTIRPPWFSYEPIPVQGKLFYETLEDFDGKRTLSDLLEDIARGESFLTEENREALKVKAGNIRRILGQSRRVIPFGPDFGFCLKAKDAGFDTYVHWGLDIHHSTFVPINNGQFIANMMDPRSWFMYAIGGEELSMDGLKDDIAMLQKLNFRGIDIDATIEDFRNEQKKSQEAQEVA